MPLQARSCHPVLGPVEKKFDEFAQIVVVAVFSLLGWLGYFCLVSSEKNSEFSKQLGLEALDQRGRQELSNCLQNWKSPPIDRLHALFFPQRNLHKGFRYGRTCPHTHVHVCGTSVYASCKQFSPKVFGVHKNTCPESVFTLRILLLRMAADGSLS